MKNGGSFHSYVNVDQRVTCKNCWHITIISLNHSYIYIYISWLLFVNSQLYTVASALSFLVAFAPARNFSTCVPWVHKFRGHTSKHPLCLATDSRTSLRILLARLPVCLLLHYLSPGSQGLPMNKQTSRWLNPSQEPETHGGWMYCGTFWKSKNRCAQTLELWMPSKPSGAELLFIAG